MEFLKKNYQGEIRAAAMRVDITDIGEQGYKGFFIKDSEIVDRLEAKINLLTADDAKFVWISLDECSIRSCSAKEIITSISQSLKIPTENIMMACVHTHSGHNHNINLELLASKLVKGVESLMKKLVVVSHIRQTIGSIKHVVNRRVDLPQDLGGYCVMFNHQCNVSEDELKLDATEQIDQFLKKSEGEKHIPLENKYCLGTHADLRIHMWELLDSNKKPVLSVVRVNAHPVIVSQSRVGAKISADYVRVLEKLIESDLGCTCSLFNGAFGDTRPLTNNYSFEDRERFAQRYYNAIKKSQSTIAPITNLTWLQFKDVGMSLRKEAPRSLEGLKKLREKIQFNINNKIGSNKRNYDLLELVEGFLLDDKKQPSAIVYNEEIEKGFACYQMNGWVIGPMKILALPGEPLTDFAAAIENGSGVLPIGLANGYLSYLPASQTIKEGGYEANQCVLSEEGIETLISLNKYFK